MKTAVGEVNRERDTLEVVRSAEMMALIRIWHDCRRNGQVIPLKENLDLLEIFRAHLAPHIWLVSKAAGEEFTYRLTGDDIRQRFGKKLTGFSIVDLYGEKLAGEIRFRWDSMFDDRLIRYSHGAVYHGVDKAYMGERLTLPLWCKGTRIVLGCTLIDRLQPKDRFTEYQVDKLTHCAIPIAEVGARFLQEAAVG